MKRVVLRVLASVFTLLFLVIPIFQVYALDYTSDYYPIKDIVNLETDDAVYENVRFNNSYFNWGELTSYGSLDGTLYSKLSNGLRMDHVIYYYDSNKNLIGQSEKTEFPPSKNATANVYGMNVILYSKELKPNHTVNDIAYYQIHYVSSVDNRNNDNNINNNINHNNSNINTIGNGEYALTKYTFNIIVNENNSFNITEYITAQFNVPKLGIYRKLPLTNQITRLDGTKARNRARITDITGNQIYKIYSSGGYRVIELGEPDGGNRSTGTKEYTINYLYNIGRDTGKGYDEFYFNLIGPEWDTTISDISFTITMPKEFDKSKLGFSSGAVGSTINNVTYEVNGNVITGSYNGVLNAGEALTVRLELPDDYFVGADNNLSLMLIIFFVLPILFAIISFILWFKYGKDEKPIETVEFYPPEGFNSAEVGFLYKGKAESKDVISLLIYLANKGYIRIEESEEKVLFSTKKGFKIVKIKEYDGNNPNERIFLNGLFKAKSVLGVTSLKEAMSMMKNPQALAEQTSTVEMQEVTATDLQNNFYITLNAIIKSLNDKENKHKIFEKATAGKSVAVILMIIVSVFTIIGIPTLEYAGIGELTMTLFITLFYVPFYAIGLSKVMPLPIRIFWLGFTMFHSAMFFMGLPIREALYDPIILVGFLLGIVSIIVMIICFKAMPKRTHYGNEILGKLKGFKNFLETAEKPKLEELFMHDPKYFYNILPYTYVLGVSDKWIKKFESIALQSPDWYSGSTAFSMASFGSFMTSTMATANSSMSSSPSSSGGGSGGGSSGGGSGGGGGGSR